MDKYRFDELQPGVQDVIAWFLEQEREVWRSFILNGHPRARPLYELYNNAHLSADDAGSFVIQLCNLLDKQESELTRLQRIEAERDKLILDTGSGCSVCGNNPVVNLGGTYWLCGSCVNEKLEDGRRIEAASREVRDELREQASEGLGFDQSLDDLADKLTAALEE